MNSVLIILTVVGVMVALLAGCAYLIQRKESQRLLAENNCLQDGINEAIEARNAAELEIRQWMTKQAETATELAAEKATHEAEVTALRQKNEEQRAAERQEREQLEKTMQLQFRNLANDILGEQSQQFRKSNQEALDGLLKPFKDNITEFRRRIEEIHSAQTSQGGEMRAELKHLMELNQRITAETTNLTNALKGNSKVQGDWGEMILETILDGSGLTKGLHYDTQYNVKDKNGRNLRPDAVLRLPEKKEIIIDSKVSLTAFVAYSSAENETERKQYLKAHITSVRQHVIELSSKEYQRLFKSPDFVIMFMPNEPAFLAALQNDPAIWSDAYNRKVIISSPTNMFALLKLVGDLWKHHHQEEHAQKIAICGQKIYDQAVAFMTSLEGVGASLKKAQESYADARKRLCSGNDNIFRLGEKMREIARFEPKKQFPKHLIEMSQESTILLPEDADKVDSENE